MLRIILSHFISFLQLTHNVIHVHDVVLMQMMGVNDPFALNFVYVTALSALGATWFGGFAQLLLLVGLPIIYQCSLGPCFDWLIRWPISKLQRVWQRVSPFDL